MVVLSKQEITDLVKEFEADAGGKSVALFGAGKIGREAIQYLRQNGVEISCVADNNKELWGNVIEGIDIIQPEKIMDFSPFIVLISNNYYTDIAKQLNELGMHHYISFFLFKGIYKVPSFENPGLSSVERACAWILNNQQSNGGVSVYRGCEFEYPEVTGYIIPTMLQYGFKEQALKMCEYLNSMINADGSFNAAGSSRSYLFDTAQALRGLNAIQTITNKYYGIQARAAKHLFSALENNNGIFPKSYEDDLIIPETIMLFALPPMLEYAEMTKDDVKIQLVHNAVKIYLSASDVISIKTLTHFLAYQIDGLIDLGYSDVVSNIIEKLLISQKEDGSIPAFEGVEWICITGCSQIAICLYKLGKYEPANRLMKWIEANMEENGGFLGSVGENSSYYPDREIAWAVKFYLDAYKMMIQSHFDNEFSLIAPEEIYADDAEVTKIISEIKDGDSILEVGCGKGRILKRIQERFPSCKLNGVDISQEMLSYVPESIATTVGDVEFLPLADNIFDVVYSVECVEHSPNLRAAVRELARVCKHGGKVIIIDKQLSGWGRLSTPPWERWPDRNILEELLKEYCDAVASSELCQKGDDERDDLFIRWIGTKKNNSKVSKKVIFFGAGADCRSALYYAERAEMKVDGIVDNNRKLWGNILGGVQIVSPEILLPADKEKFRIIITVGYKFLPQIKEQLVEYGYDYGVDFFEWSHIFLGGYTDFGDTSGVLDIAPHLKMIKTVAKNRLIVDKTANCIYRLISNELKDEYEKVYTKCVSGELLGKFIVNTELSDIHITDGYSLCFKHEFLPLFTYAVEWSPRMFYSYTLFMLDLFTELDKCGLCCLDGHAFNATFHNGKFLFFDFDAIRLGKMPYFYLQEFINDHCIILLMMSENLLDKAYLYLNNAGKKLSFKDVSSYLSEEKIKRFNNAFSACREHAGAGDIQSCCEILKDYVKSIQFVELFQTGWNGYQNELYDESKKMQLSQKQKTVIEMVRSVKPATVIDLAGNMGWYSFALHNEVKYCISADLDYACVDFVFKKVVDSRKKNIFPVYLNIITPTPAYYRDTPIGNTAIVPWRVDAIERFKSEMVLSLAVMHHLAFAQQLSFAEIVGQIGLFSTRWIIIEWIEREDSVVAPVLKNADFSWYNKQNFERELNKHFKIRLVENSEPTRVLYLCEKLS